MKKICILSCGGTFFMRRDRKGILFPYYGTRRLLEKIPEITSIADIKVEDVTNIDSTNMDVKIWSKLALKIFSSYKDYDGFIIIHGTDTMAYTASALSFALQNFNKPIILTGAQKPLDDINSDGRNNLLNAILVALLKIPDVSIVFGSRILKGVRATKVSESNLDAFDSPIVGPLGEISLTPTIRKDINFKKNKTQLLCMPNFDPNVVVITLHPSIPIEFLRQFLKLKCRGIILKAFGAGNIPDNLIPFLREAKLAEIPVIILSQCNEGITQMQLYHVGKEALKTGAIAGYDMTLEAAVTKLMWGLANTKNVGELRKLFDKNLAGEVTL